MDGRHGRGEPEVNGRETFGESPQDAVAARS